MIIVYCLCIFLITTTSDAQQSAEHSQAPTEAQNRVEKSPEDPTTSTTPPLGHESQQVPNPKPLKRFIPKERIPADSAISFPTDI